MFSGEMLEVTALERLQPTTFKCRRRQKCMAERSVNKTADRSDFAM